MIRPHYFRELSTRNLDALHCLLHDLMTAASDLRVDSSILFNFEFPFTPAPSDEELLSLSRVSDKYNRDGSVDFDHMDPSFYKAQSDIAQPHLVADASLPHFKSPHFRRHMMQVLDRYLHYPGHLADPATPGKASGNTKGGQESHEYFNLPAVDVRTTAQWCYFDIELPGVTDKAGINIHWISSQSFIVEGEIPRPRISVGDELDDDPTVQGWTKITRETVDPPSGLISLSGVPTRKHSNTLVHESIAPTGETAPKPNDKYPGFPHLVRSPGSGEGGGPDGLTKRTSTDPREPEDNDPRVLNSSFTNDEFSTFTTKPYHACPMDEVALIHSRSNSSKSSSRFHKPHNDHDVQHGSIFSFLSNHNEHQSPQHVVHENSLNVAAPVPGNNDSRSSTFSDVLRPIENGHEPQLVLAERMIGTYKRRCTVPENVELCIKRTEVRLEAGVLTVRVPRRREKEGEEEEDEEDEEVEKKG